MRDINVLTLSGRLSKEPELRAMANGTLVLQMSIAYSRTKKVGDKYEDEPNFIDCTLFGARAEALDKILSKGSKVWITGELKQERWTAKDGKNRSAHKIIIDQIQTESRQKPQAQASSDFYDAYDEDIPF